MGEVMDWVFHELHSIFEQLCFTKTSPSLSSVCFVLVIYWRHYTPGEGEGNDKITKKRRVFPAGWRPFQARIYWLDCSFTPNAAAGALEFGR
jgi:hypothetical protein